jgi:hypothetical protein
MRTTVLYATAITGLVCLFIIHSCSKKPEGFTNPEPEADNEDATSQKKNYSTKPGGVDLKDEHSPYKKEENSEQQPESAATNEEEATKSEQDMYVLRPVASWSPDKKREPVCVPKNLNVVRPTYTTGARSDQLDMTTFMLNKKASSQSLYNISKSNMGH